MVNYQNVGNTIEKHKLTTRPPIVVVLGHVDHGKSSLLEAIREDFRITSKESGGITQHIGAYQADFQGKKITFIDTPGHELFSAMRSRGAKVADIAILVVAADEGVKPQTIEALAQIKKAGIPMIVALNKIDKPEANVQKVKQELAQQGVMVESLGGNVPSVETSATTKQGMKELLEMILLVAEIGDLKADYERPGEGIIIESYMDKNRGSAATILVQNGSVKKGDFIGTSTTGGKIRILEDFEGHHIQTVSPAMPAVVFGFGEAPRVGEQFHIFASEEHLKESFAGEERRREEVRVATLDPAVHLVNIIIKADAAGSLEVLEEVLRNLPFEGVALRIVKASVGEVSENDVKLARSAGAYILAFRVSISPSARDIAEKDNISIQTFDIIYELIQAARELMATFVKEDESQRKDLGSLLVLAVFLVDKKRQVIGGKVIEGRAQKGVKAEIIRGDVVVATGKIANVQHNKKDVPSVSKGQECGLSFEGEEKIQVGDLIKFFIEKPEKQ